MTAAGAWSRLPKTEWLSPERPMPWGLPPATRERINLGQHVVLSLPSRAVNQRETGNRIGCSGDIKIRSQSSGFRSPLESV